MTYSLSLNLPTVSVVGHKSPIYGQRKPYFKDQRQFKLVIEKVLKVAVSMALTKTFANSIFLFNMNIRVARVPSMSIPFSAVVVTVSRFWLTLGEVLVG